MMRIGGPLLVVLLWLGALGQAEEPEYKGHKLSVWVKELEAPNVTARSRAAQVLGEMGTKARSAAPALMRALKDLDWEVRRDAVVALAEVGGELKLTVPALTEALKDSEQPVRLSAVKSLGKIGLKNPELAVPPLMGAFKAQDELVQGYAASHLAKIGEPAVPALCRGLMDDDQRARVWSAHALGRIGFTARPAVPALTKALQDKDREVRRVAAQAIQNIRADPTKKPPKKQ